jgi:hypothetical protein
MNRCVSGSIMLAVAGMVSTASAAITFSNITIDGSLAGGATFNVGPDNCIDFIFPAATVGDTVDPLRSGNIVITYEATGTGGDSFNSMLAVILGALSGSGQIFFNEIIEDLNGGGVIGSYNANITDNSQLPFYDTIQFSQSSTHIKVKKTIVLDAIDTAAFDLANVSLVEQCLIPTPGSAMLLGVAALPMLRRRRA